MAHTFFEWGTRGVQFVTMATDGKGEHGGGGGGKSRVKTFAAWGVSLGCSSTHTYTQR